MKNLYLLAIATVLSFAAKAQCSVTIASSAPNYVLDTTYIAYYAVGSSLSPVTAYTWYFSDDSTTYIGDTVVRAFTGNAALYASLNLDLTAVDTGCSTSDSTYSGYPYVFNCSFQSAPEHNYRVPTFLLWV